MRLVGEYDLSEHDDLREHARCGNQGEEKRPVWLGAATEDRGVGVSRYTGAVTHHISPDLDAERALLAADLEDAGMVDAKYQVTGIGPTVAALLISPENTRGALWLGAACLAACFAEALDQRQTVARVVELSVVV